MNNIAIHTLPIYNHYAKIVKQNKKYILIYKTHLRCEGILAAAFHLSKQVWDVHTPQQSKIN